MEPVSASSTTEAGLALDEAGPFLRARPVENNLVLALLEQRAAALVEGRYWSARRYGEIVGFAFLSPLWFRAVLSPWAEPAVVDALVDRMAEEAPNLAAVTSDAATAATFAGRWAERRRVPAVPVEGQRIYRLGSLRPPPAVPGAFRQAAAADRDLLVDWAGRFVKEAQAGGTDPAETVDRHLGNGRLWLWERDGRPVSMAAASVPTAGVSRVALVYTPVEDRRQGYAAACVAALSAQVVRAGAGQCILYTQLSNPTSNAIYRRIGYEPVMEALIYRFG